MLRSLPILTLLVLSSAANAQTLSKKQADRLDVRLRSVLPASVAGTVAAIPRPPARWTGADGEERFGVIIYTEDVGGLRARGVPVNAEHEGFATAMVSARELADLAQAPGVRYVDAGDVRYPQNDVASALVGASLLHDGAVGGTSYMGAGVVMCVLDSGIDYTHEDFRDPSDPTKSRILFIWDQTLTATGGESAPAEGCCSYGVEYSKSDIEDEIDGSPAGFVRQEDTNGHGTHVTGTAAGNGSSLSPAEYVGMAPEADIIMIKAGNGSFPTSNIINGFSYCDAKATALGKPAVMNLSLGSDAGPHDGTDPESVAADAFSSGAGRLAVYSAGNSGSDLIHKGGAIANGATESFTFTVPAYTAQSGSGNDSFGFELWFSTSGNVTVTVDSPNITGAATFNPGDSGPVATNDGAIVGDNDIDVGNGDRSFWLFVYDSDAAKPPAQGTWTVWVENTSGASMDYHGWQFDDTIGDSDELVTLTGADSDYTLSTSSSNTVIVASYVHRWRWESESTCCYAYSFDVEGSDDISSFSSVGPTRDGRQKPDITAPGQGMISSLSKDVGLSASSSRYIAGGRHYLTQGTSMSSPVVAGAAALLFEADPGLTASEARSLITGSADVDSYTGAVWNSSWGAGRLNIFRAMIDLLDSGSSGNREILAYDEWAAGLNPTTLGAGQGAGVRFTPTLSGAVEGVFIHTYDGSPTGNVSVEIWTDSGGLPGSMLGSAVSVPASQLDDATWNYVNLSSANVGVTAGTDYHVLVVNSGGTLGVEKEGTSVDNRSTANGGSGWFAWGSDWRMRPVVADGTVALPVELAMFRALLDEQDVVVQWQTASEIDNAGFGIEMKGPSYGASYQEMAFVAGAGTSSLARDYEYRIPAVAPGDYLIRLRQVALDGSVEYSPEVLIEVGVASEYFVEAPYPNPFNPRTSFKLAVARAQHVRADVFDVTGRRIVTLMDDEIPQGSTRSIELDASQLATGMYVIRIAGEHFSRTERVVLVK